MKTTLTLPDDVFRRAKARAALRGQTFGKFLEQTLQKSLAASEERGSGDWLQALPKLPRGATSDLQRIMEASDFRTVDRAMWE